MTSRISRDVATLLLPCHEPDESGEFITILDPCNVWLSLPCLLTEMDCENYRKSDGGKCGATNYPIAYGGKCRVCKAAIPMPKATARMAVQFKHIIWFMKEGTFTMLSETTTGSQNVHHVYIPYSDFFDLMSAIQMSTGRIYLAPVETDGGGA